MKNFINEYATTSDMSEAAILSGKQMKSLDECSAKFGIRDDNLLENIGKEEIETKITDLSQNFYSGKSINNAKVNIEKIPSQVIGYNNNKQNDKESLESLSINIDLVMKISCTRVFIRFCLILIIVVMNWIDK